MDFIKPNTQLYNVPFRVLDGFNGMPYRQLGSSGLRVSNVGLGTWKMGYPETGDGSRIDEKQARDIFDRAIELGVTFWDTANRYNNASGNSERIIGKWMKDNEEQRRNVIVATKLFGGMDGHSPNHSGLSRSNILDSVYASLQRMQLTYIDVLYFHQFDAHTPVEESIAAIEDLVRQQVIRYFAVSNFSPDQLESYRKVIQDVSPRSRITAVQNNFDLLNGETPNQTGTLAYSAEHGISYVAWSPLARGLLSDRYVNPDRLGPGNRLYDEGDLDKALEPAIKQKLQKLASLSQAWGMELNQLALAYMLTLPGMGPVIPSSSTVKQLEANAAAGKLVLTEEQQDKVREALLAE
ncbi:MAG: channel subunit beta, partial [Paenibacillus sp.]|nr:channel subunit beta [Paenibacillus sp.]